ncbi:FecR family protein [Parapedobacter indicus]|uniref:FecR family protein n=1 Tax=Parapedobacter indicus TaxID=1477437 RepID=A0A1I3J9W9_9SPHI|nr:FecR family protein [Parapedobacter indicus]PPL02443.1 FecR family protein [Parapedobacter indicus]SFI56993.1 FecR family protein [Parapedobacter indicus]
MGRKSFHQLLQRYLDGRCSPAEEQLVDHWYRLLDDGNEQFGINPSNLHTIEDALWKKIHDQVNDAQAAANENVRSMTPYRRIRYGLAIAAAAILLIVGGTAAYLRLVCYPVVPTFTSGTAKVDSNIVLVKNDTEHRMNIILSDESLVELYPEASLEYPKRFTEGRREVRLVGNAFFSVVANKSNPFWVFHEGMITKVLGTKFKIMAPKGNAKGEVIVYSGKVDVFYNAGSRNIVERILSTPPKASVTTNQKAVLMPKSLKETVTENPLPVSERGDAICRGPFHDIPMTALAETLSELYALDVVADNGLSHITFTGDISGIGLFKQLDIICMVTDTRYEVIGTTIFLKDK